MTKNTGEQGKKNGLHAETWYEEEPEIATWEDEDSGDTLLHTCACDISGEPISLRHNLGELLEFGIHIVQDSKEDDIQRSWRANDHLEPFDENELPRIYYEAGAHHALGCLPGDNPRFMLPGDLTKLSVPYRDRVAETLI